MNMNNVHKLQQETDRRNAHSFEGWLIGQNSG